MAVQEIPKRVFYQITVDGVINSAVFTSKLVVGQNYILMADKYNFDNGRDVDIYNIISDTQADVQQVNKYNYQSLLTNNVTRQLNDVYQAIYIDNRAIGRIICDNRVIWQKARIMLLDLSGARGLQVSYNATTITIVFDVIPNREKLEEFFAASNKDLLLTIDNQSYDVVAAEYVKFASLVKFTVTQFSSYKNTTATNVTVAVKTDDTAQSQTLLFDGRPTTTFTKLDLYKTYIFERSGYPPETREATAIDFGYLKLGDGHLLINKSDTGLYIKSYGTAFDVKIYGKN
ncbi:phage protein [Streptococcus dysgalactiae subsp. dysgalactiae]|nr:hypothetical protein [Streptococcus dysgalactiae]VDZ39835.1 phage protein [Streptococcus dysgalactiae subsp. dysgalactiae]